jgi:hypothetical protein
MPAIGHILCPIDFSGFSPKASCPMLGVRSTSYDYIGPDRQQVSVRLCRILSCTDFTRNSQRALDYAIARIAEYNAELTLLLVLKVFLSIGQYPIGKGQSE